MRRWNPNLLQQGDDENFEELRLFRPIRPRSRFFETLLVLLTILVVAVFMGLSLVGLLTTLQWLM